VGVRVRPFEMADEQAVVELWAACGLVRPWNDPHLDIGRKLADSPDGLLVAEDDGVVIGTVMAGYDGHRGWVNYLAVDPSRRRGGIGQALMAAAEDLLGALGCPKVNLQVRDGNDDARRFYEAIGYGRDAVVSFGKRLAEDG
jgi:ribosomal protein S18 acetylase RimI-like enzyme